MKLTPQEEKQILERANVGDIEVLEPKPHHSGKGTRARLNTAAEKRMFNSQYSK